MTKMLDLFKEATAKFRGMSGLTEAQSKEVDQIYRRVSVGLTPEQSRPLRDIVKELKYSYQMDRISGDFVKEANKIAGYGKKADYLSLMRSYAAAIKELNELVRADNIAQYHAAFDRMTDAAVNAR
jgi:hypothetical protein